MPERGAILAIGGHEDRVGERTILRHVSASLGGRPLALITAASRNPDGYVATYRSAFADLGVEVVELPGDRAAARAVLERAGGAFMTGGSQLRLTHHLRATGIIDDLVRLRDDGGIVAGTSAGASAMADRMIVRGPGRRSPGTDDLRLGDGLGLVTGVIIDQHFAERGRAGRLRAAVADEPGRVGLGIDEDTAVEFSAGSLSVHGSGAVTVIDARGSAVRGGTDGRPATIRAATLHILAAGDTMTLTELQSAT